MGRGNVCVTGKYEGLYYIDRDYTDVYRRSDEVSDDEFETRLLGELSYDELTGGDWLYDVLECFTEGFTRMFPSFKRVEKDKWHDRSIRIILESELFYVGVEDNEWSVAVKLLQKEDPYDNHLEGLQKRRYQQYLDGMKKVLLERLPSIGTYSGAWTSGRITRDSENITER